MARLIGAKCHRCADVLGSTHEVEHSEWLTFTGLQCPSCLFCQERALSRLIGEVGLDLFDIEVREAVEAFRADEPHPLIDQLRAEITDHIGGTS